MHICTVSCWLVALMNEWWCEWQVSQLWHHWGEREVEAVLFFMLFGLIWWLGGAGWLCEGIEVWGADIWPARTWGAALDCGPDCMSEKENCLWGYPDTVNSEVGWREEWVFCWKDFARVQEHGVWPDWATIPHMKDCLCWHPLETWFWSALYFSGVSNAQIALVSDVFGALCFRYPLQTVIKFCKTKCWVLLFGWGYIQIQHLLEMLQSLSAICYYNHSITSCYIYI